jgi:hypothetical protein
MAHGKSRFSGWPALSLAAAIAVAGSAWGQTAPSDRDHQPKSETEGQSPSSSGDLSRRLDRSQGVIQPPQAVDPQMQLAPPNPDAKMPVIPPPGSPGGNETVEPK